jgi:hypothetical protein
LPKVVARISGRDGRGQRHAQRAEHAGGDFQLGPVGVALAVAELQQPLLGQDVGVGIGRGGVDADEAGGEPVGADGLLIQVAPRGTEGGASAEPGEPVGEPAAMGVGGQDGFAQQGGEGAPVPLDSRLDVPGAMVPLRDDEEGPDGQDFAWGERSFPVRRVGEVAVQGGGQIRTLRGGPQDGEFGHDFDTQRSRLGGVHPSGLLTPPIPENHPQTRASRLA